VFQDLFVLSTMRELSNRFQHSTSTVHNNLHQVAKALMKCKHMLYFVPSINEEVHSRLLDPKYRFFNMPGKQLVGCYDGTHIDAIPPPGEESAFRNRKHGVTQNVLGVCNFDMLFQYGHYGWEGSAHDGKVFLDAFNKGFPWREGQYYLADAGYALRSYCLTPYRGIRYHLKEWHACPNKPENKEELFNLRHSSLRNVVERIFGVLKKRFPILVKMEQFKFVTNRDDIICQVDIVECCVLLHNFIRSNTLYEKEYFCDLFDVDYVGQDVADVNVHADNQCDDTNDNYRDLIAQNMWDDYQLYLERNRL
jgi:hypothetical protein